MIFLRSYHVKHRRDFTIPLQKALDVANYAVKNKTKYPSTKNVKHIDLHSDIKNQIMRKYGQKSIKKVHNIQLIVPNTTRKYKMKDGTIKTYNNITYEKGIVNIIPLKTQFRWNPGKDFKRINCVTVDKSRFIIQASFDYAEKKDKFTHALGVDLNCGVGRHIANIADLKNNHVVNFGKNGPNIRKKYFMKRKNNGCKGNRESRIMKDIDHKISRAIVNYALKNKLKIVLEDLTGLRKKIKTENGCRERNRLVSSWSYYRLQKFMEYKAEQYQIPVIYINPRYTSQECSYCGVIGTRDKKFFVCKNKKCVKKNIFRNSDINAAFNIGKRSLQKGGRTIKK